ncbi:MAG TPA: hypothetical protein VFJ65_01410 [Solirubrobacterales bacterium]|nr:hypothetical protein [Solirubrobacterales bacterium]
MITGRSMDPHEEDSAVQTALMNHVLDEHPSLLSRADLIRELSSKADDWAHRDPIERAIAQLIQRGLLDCLGDYILPTRPALYCRALGL